MPCLRSGAVFPSHASSRTWDELMPEIVASNVSVQRAALAYMGSGASAAALRRVSSGPASPLGGRPEVPRVRRDADTFAPLPRAPAAPPQRRAWASSASAASERTRVGSKQELESALASAQAALQAATERVAALETANGEGAAALRRAASPLGGRPEAPRVRRDADSSAPLPRTPPQRRAWASSASAASERTRVGSKQELESALASAQAALQAATERVAALETANEILRSQVAFLGASAEDSKNFIVSSK